LADVKNAYEAFEFHKAYKRIYEFCNESLSMYYLDMIKGRLYTYAANSKERRAAQATIYHALNILVRIISPILVFTAEEIWQNMPKEQRQRDIISAHLLEWPKEITNFTSFKGNDEFAVIIGLIPSVAKLLEELRSKGGIGSSFDAKINLLTNEEERYTFLTSLKDQLCEIFKVSEVEIIKTDNLNLSSEENKNSLKLLNIVIQAFKAEGTKCTRCWNYSQSVGHDKIHPTICNRCLKTLGG
jgi:isoleucyl-tRNA synthetase